MPNPFFVLPWARDRYRVGPCDAYLDSFADSLRQKGYRYSTGQYYVHEVGHLSRWLDPRGVGITKINEEDVQRYLRTRRQSVRPRLSRAIHLFLQHLKQLGVIASPERCVPKDACDALIDRFERHLKVDRGLCRETIRHHIRFANRFLRHRYGDKTIDLSKLSAQDLPRYVLRESRKVSRGTAKVHVCALRVFLRFLRSRGDISIDLAASVPSVPTWRLSSLPESFSAKQVDDIVNGCDRRSPQGLRDRAILLFLSRLGLRAIEVQRMTLEDIDWEAGCISVRGKDGEPYRLPLPHDVGQALVRYLRNCRPSCSSRRVFVRAVAPHSGFANSSTVSTVARKAILRAGLRSPRLGSHVLRHACATEMLRNGASIQEIGQILRHRKAETTAIYAKVDFNQLKLMTQPWPGGKS